MFKMMLLLLHFLKIVLGGEELPECSVGIRNGEGDTEGNWSNEKKLVIINNVVVFIIEYVIVLWAMGWHNIPYICK